MLLNLFYVIISIILFYTIRCVVAYRIIFQSETLLWKITGNFIIAGLYFLLVYWNNKVIYITLVTLYIGGSVINSILLRLAWQTSVLFEFFNQLQLKFARGRIWFPVLFTYGVYEIVIILCSNKYFANYIALILLFNFPIIMDCYSKKYASWSFKTEQNFSLFLNIIRAISLLSLQINKEFSLGISFLEGNYITDAIIFSLVSEKILIFLYERQKTIRDAENEETVEWQKYMHPDKILLFEVVQFIEFSGRIPISLNNYSNDKLSVAVAQMYLRETICKGKNNKYYIDKKRFEEEYGFSLDKMHHYRKNISELISTGAENDNMTL